MSDRCFVSRSSFDQFGESLDSKKLPVVGGDRRRSARRVQARRRILVALAGLGLIMAGIAIKAMI